jgi:hypothetical protein
VTIRWTGEPDDFLDSVEKWLDEIPAMKATGIVEGQYTANPTKLINRNAIEVHQRLTRLADEALTDEQRDRARKIVTRLGQTIFGLK